jgi:hypothetical protein
MLAIGEAIPAAYATVRRTVTIRKNCLYLSLGVCDALDNSPNGHIMRRVHVSTEGTKALGREALDTSDFAREASETALKEYEGYLDESLAGLAAH